MRGVVALLRWQLLVRLECDPIDADTKMAQIEGTIRRKLGRGPLTDAALKKSCNADRCGIGMWQKALGNLSNGGEIERATVGSRQGWRLT
jgi:hypothetical protein